MENWLIQTNFVILVGNLALWIIRIVCLYSDADELRVVDYIPRINPAVRINRDLRSHPYISYFLAHFTIPGVKINLFSQMR